LLARIPYLKPLQRLLAQANLGMPLGVVLLLAGLLALLGFLVGAVGHANPIIMLGGAAAGGFLPIFYLTLKKKQRIEQFQRQFPDALELVARALRAGHAFLVGMRMVGEEFHDPIGTEFTRAVDEIGLGMDVPESLKNLAERVESLDMKFFVTSLIVQRETGGNLAEIIESISQLIRKRFELQGRIKALSAEGRLSAYVLFGLPLVIALAIYLLNPGYMALLWTDPMGRTMVTGGLVMMVIGLVVTKQMIAIKV
jgi:tight adherence protein B